MLVDTSGRSQTITLFGKAQKMPIVIAPTGSAGLAWHEGEIALARAAKAAGIPFTVATGSMTALERVAAEAGGKPATVARIALRSIRATSIVNVAPAGRPVSPDSAAAQSARTRRSCRA